MTTACGIMKSKRTVEKESQHGSDHSCWHEGIDSNHKTDGEVTVILH